MMIKHTGNAASAFLEFSSKMKRWNERFYPLMVQNAVEAVGPATAELEQIFESHVWPDAIRGIDRLKSPTTSQPSDYDPENDIIEDAEIKGSTCIFHVQTTTGFKDKFRYTMKNRNGEWKLFRKDFFMDSSGKWRSHHI